MVVSCDCCVLSGIGLCDGPIPHPEEVLTKVYVCVYVTECVQVQKKRILYKYNEYLENVRLRKWNSSLPCAYEATAPS